MKIEARIFLLVSLFCVVACIVYATWSNAAYGHVEWAGSVALLLSGGLLGISGSFFWFVSRRIDPRPEDRSDGEIAEAAGELGFFSPGSYWPFGLGAAAALTALGFAFVQVWLVVVGFAAVLFSAGGLVFEYYSGGRRPAAR
jgi:hypothetical protein